MTVVLFAFGGFALGLVLGLLIRRFGGGNGQTKDQECIFFCDDGRELSTECAKGPDSFDACLKKLEAKCKPAPTPEK